MFTGRSGSTTTCKHFQELTRAPGIKSDWRIYGIGAVYDFFNRLRATPVVVGRLATVPPGDRFPSPVPEVMSEAREVQYARLLAGTFFSLDVL